MLRDHAQDVRLRPVQAGPRHSAATAGVPGDVGVVTLPDLRDWPGSLQLDDAQPPHAHNQIIKVNLKVNDASQMQMNLARTQPQSP